VCVMCVLCVCVCVCVHICVYIATGWFEFDGGHLDTFPHLNSHIHPLSASGRGGGMVL